MKYEVILFDADETLFDFRRSEREAFQNTMLEFAIAYDEAYHLKVYQEINRVIWKEFEDGLITQKKLKTERFQRLSDQLQTGFDPDKFAESYLRHLAGASFLYEDSLELVQSLYMDYRLGIVTNGLADVQHGRIGRSAIAPYFADVVISEEVQVSKPDPKIFALALHRLQYTDKSKVLMVGDSLTSDIQGGINFGMDTCWLNTGRSVNTTAIRPTYEIAGLLELKTILAFHS